MRISFCKLFRKTALLQQLPYPLLCFFPGNSGISETFPDPFPQRPARVERADRILKNHLNFPADLSIFFSFRISDLLAAQGKYAAVRLFKTAQKSGQRTFPASGFTHNSKRLPRHHLKGNMIYRIKFFLFSVFKRFGQIGNFQNWFHLFPPKSGNCRQQIFGVLPARFL